MTNAESCQARAARYRAMAARAESAGDDAARRACLRLAALWRDMVTPAKTFDRLHDAETRRRIFAMIDEAEHRRGV